MRKGVDSLLDAFFKIAQEIPTAELAIVGQRYSQKQEAVDYEKRLILQVENSLFSKRISWLGIRNDIPNLMRQSTILIHPARQEPLGRVLLESAASGLPMIATDVGGTSEILSPTEFNELLGPLQRVQQKSHEKSSNCQIHPKN